MLNHISVFFVHVTQETGLTKKPSVTIPAHKLDAVVKIRQMLKNLSLRVEFLIANFAISFISFLSMNQIDVFVEVGFCGKNDFRGYSKTMWTGFMESKLVKKFL